ncbi:hypothetical protein GGR56DRAFT_399975 [Xylariaceae sp. FL0804]|nr:hypothetical protein GGR56DRAFT_399975 [Xylariaceae sp. FL0804]
MAIFDEQGRKVACAPCIRGHRSSKCTHANEREMQLVRKPGRPLSSPSGRPLSSSNSASSGRCQCAFYASQSRARRQQNGQAAGQASNGGFTPMAISPIWQQPAGGVYPSPMQRSSPNDSRSSSVDMTAQMSLAHPGQVNLMNTQQGLPYRPRDPSPPSPSGFQPQPSSSATQLQPTQLQTAQLQPPPHPQAHFQQLPPPAESHQQQPRGPYQQLSQDPHYQQSPQGPYPSPPAQGAPQGPYQQLPEPLNGNYGQQMEMYMQFSAQQQALQQQQQSLNGAPSPPLPPHHTLVGTANDCTDGTDDDDDDDDDDDGDPSSLATSAGSSSVATSEAEAESSSSTTATDSHHHQHHHEHQQQQQQQPLPPHLAYGSAPAMPAPPAPAPATTTYWPNHFHDPAPAAPDQFYYCAMDDMCSGEGGLCPCGDACACVGCMIHGNRSPAR